MLLALEMVENEDAKKKGLSIEETDIKVLFLEIIFIAEQNNTVLPAHAQLALELHLRGASKTLHVSNPS